MVILLHIHSSMLSLTITFHGTVTPTCTHALTHSLTHSLASLTSVQECAGTKIPFFGSIDRLSRDYQRKNFSRIKYKGEIYKYNSTRFVNVRANESLLSAGDSRSNDPSKSRIVRRIYTRISISTNIRTSLEFTMCVIIRDRA